MIIIQKSFSTSTPYSQNSSTVFAEDLTPTNSTGSGEKNWVRVRFGKSDTPVSYYNLPKGSKSSGYIGMPLNPPADKDRLADLSPHNPDGTPIIENDSNGSHHSPVAAGLIGAGILTAGYLLRRRKRKNK